MTLTPKQLGSVLEILRLKTIPREGWKRHPIPGKDVESVADHSYGVALLCCLLAPENLDKSRVLELAILHDLPEVVTGDVTPADGISSEQKNSDELKAMKSLTQGLGASEHWQKVLEDYQKQGSAEARWVKKMDKLEMTLQSLVYESEHPVDLREFRESASSQLKELGCDWLIDDEGPLR